MEGSYQREESDGTKSEGKCTSPQDRQNHISPVDKNFVMHEPQLYKILSGLLKTLGDFISFMLSEADGLKRIDEDED